MHFLPRLLIVSLGLVPLAEAAPKKKKSGPKLSEAAAADKLHPLWRMENVYPDQDVQLKVSGLAFGGDDIYVTVFTPDRLNKAPFKKGEVYKVTGVIGNSDRSKIKAHRLMGDLYEPTGIAVHKGKIYIGEKDKISRLEDKNGDGVYSADEKVVLMDGLSHVNFHTYTVGFEKLVKDGKTYLVGNLTTSIRPGGARDFNVTVNPKTHRGSTFVFGPVTGEEKPSEVDISYYAGGYRTPNGIAVGPNDEIIVTDNQGVFNPSNEYIRLTPGGFYGHFLLKKDNTNIAAFQPEDVDDVKGGSKYQSPPTVHLPQGEVSRSPSQPVVLKDLKGPMSVYNGQWLVGDVTLGRLNRIFLEEVDGTWQGAAFLHSGGHDPEGKTGLTAGPNRLKHGPDGNIYLGHIGEGGLWQFLPAPGEDPKPPYGLQRLSHLAPQEIPADFNEMVAVRDRVGGLEIELFKPITQAQLDAAQIEAKQWTYVPTNGYGGRNMGTEKLTLVKKTLSEDGKRIMLTLPGIRDNSAPFVSKGGYTSENVGWVVHLTVDQLDLYKNAAWYTMVKHQGGGAKEPIKKQLDPKTEPIAYAKSQHKAVCAACHSTDGSRLVGPSFKGLFGKKQQVIRDGETSTITVNDAYLRRAIANPMLEHPVGFPPAMPNPNLSKEEQKAVIKWIKTLK